MCTKQYDLDLRDTATKAKEILARFRPQPVYNDWKRIYLQQFEEILHKLCYAEKMPQHELEQIIREVAWIRLMAGIFLDELNLTDAEGRQPSCTNDCGQEQIENTKKECEGEDTSWPCTCCFWPNVQFAACITDCILD